LDPGAGGEDGVGRPEDCLGSGRRRGGPAAPMWLVHGFREAHACWARTSRWACHVRLLSSPNEGRRWDAAFFACEGGRSCVRRSIVREPRRFASLQSPLACWATPLTPARGSCMVHMGSAITITPGDWSCGSTGLFVCNAHSAGEASLRPAGRRALVPNSSPCEKK